MEGELPDGSAMLKNYLINDEQYYREVKFSEGIFLLLTNISQRKRLHENKLLLHINILMCVYIYMCHGNFKTILPDHSPTKITSMTIYVYTCVNK